MRELDTNGLRLVEFQGKLFEESVIRFECSTKVFLRRFFYSDLLVTLDKNDSSLISFSLEESFQSIEAQFGKSSYGKDKWNSNVLFWIGFIYRYIAFTRDVETKFIMKLFEPDMLKNLYYAYHTQNNEWVVENLLSLRNVDEKVFDKNYRLLNSLKLLV
ncbi:MAG: hypothetical protein WCS49_02410 [Bacilli bacterium]